MYLTGGDSGWPTEEIYTGFLNLLLPKEVW